jgi:hypothetical protein
MLREFKHRGDIEPGPALMLAREALLLHTTLKIS